MLSEPNIKIVLTDSQVATQLRFKGGEQVRLLAKLLPNLFFEGVFDV